MSVQLRMICEREGQRTEEREEKRGKNKVLVLYVGSTQHGSVKV